MEKYSKAVSEMYSQFVQREAHPMEKYLGHFVSYKGRTREVVGYAAWSNGLCSLIVEASEDWGWSALGHADFVFKECKYYLYAEINTLIN